MTVHCDSSWGSLPGESVPQVGFVQESSQVAPQVCRFSTHGLSFSQAMLSTEPGLYSASDLVSWLALQYDSQISRLICTGLAAICFDFALDMQRLRSKEF